MTKKYKTKSFKSFNDCGNCKGHGNFMLDSSLEQESDRESVIMAISNYLPKDAANTKKT